MSLPRLVRFSALGLSQQLLTLGGLFGPDAGHFRAKFDDATMVDHAVNGGSGGEWVLEDLVPLGKNEIGGNDDTASLVPFGQKGKENLHFLLILLNIAKIIQNNHGEAVEAFEFPLQFVISFGPQQAIDQFEGGTEEDPVAALDPFKGQGLS